MDNIFMREEYLNRIRGFYHSDVIKVVTGIRRCGKSFFLLSVIKDLKNNGVSESNIININLDKRGFKNIKTADRLEEVIEGYITDNEKKYIFIDEIQNVKGFEEVINAYREDGHSIFITGSNSYLLSGELITKLTGRYIEIEMFTLTFCEYLEMKRFLKKDISKNIAEEFTAYIRDGGFPKSLEFDNIDDRNLYVQSAVTQIFEKDISKNKKIRNRTAFEKIQSFVINNFGSTISVSNIAEYLRGENIAVKEDTIYRYIEMLENAKIIYKCPRFDLKSKQSMKMQQKYYLADLSIYYSMNVDGRINYGPVLENILFCYLKSKGYKLSVGKIGNLECDFIVRQNKDDYFYIQVAMTIAEQSTEEREYKPFTQIRDNFPKYLFTTDTLLQKRDGILHLNMIDFIKDNKTL
ncbi:MAG: ATP-binding protein [Oscillospiraceae bacterium]|nr:ATP-binding protein [Oscillospiraceae bacterium]